MTHFKRVAHSDSLSNYSATSHWWKQLLFSGGICLAGLGVAQAQVQQTGHSFGPKQRCCPPSYSQPYCPTPSMTPIPAVPSVPEADPNQPPQLPQDAPDIDFNPDTSVSSGFGAASGPSSSTPGMLGDSYITGAHVNYTLNTGESFSATIPYGGRYKCADNTGPVPTDRVSFAYKHFHNALDQISTDATGGMTPQSSTGHIDMYTLGLEKSFMDQLFSVEFDTDKESCWTVGKCDKVEPQYVRICQHGSTGFV